ncbi:MAG: SBBP repeat-containing protein, partial [Candidatus Thorarchaeota archaeon]
MALILLVVLVVAPLAVTPLAEFQWNTRIVDSPESLHGNELSKMVFTQSHSQEDAINVAYSTFLGDTELDISQAIAVEDGNIYVTGATMSPGFPTFNANDSTFNGGWDVFITKLAPDGRSLLYSTFLGGSGNEVAYGIAVENGEVYVTGYTTSANFPTVNANDTTHNGQLDAFVTKLSADGQTIIYSTFLGGSGFEQGNAIVVENGYAYVAGYTQSTNFATANAYDPTPGGSDDGFVTKLSTDGQTLIYSTYLGGSSSDEVMGIAVENGFAYVGGDTASANFPTVNAYDSTLNGATTWDVFMTKFAADGQSLVYSTFVGGSSNDHVFAIALENGNAYVTGYTPSTDFPTVNAYDSTYNGGMWDSIVFELAGDGQSLVYSTYLGGSAEEIARGIAVENGHAYVFGDVHSSNFPIISASQSTKRGGSDYYITKLTSDGQSLVYSTYLGGSLDEDARGIAVEDGVAYVAGYTESTDIPTVDAYDPIYD